jgi:hypothetical protein
MERGGYSRRQLFANAAIAASRAPYIRATACGIKECPHGLVPSIVCFTISSSMNPGQRFLASVAHVQPMGTKTHVP